MQEQLTKLFQQKRSLTLKDMEEQLQLQSSNEFRTLMKTLNQMEEERLIFTNHNHYDWIDEQTYMIGKVKDVSKMEFAIVNKEQKVYVYKKYAKNVFQQDEVLVKKGKVNEIVHIYQRGITNIVGTFVRVRGEFKFRSDIDLHRTFVVKNIREFALAHNVKAVVYITKYAEPMEVKIAKILGPATDAGVDITALLFENNVRQVFSSKVEKEVAKIPDHVTIRDMHGRKDFRKLCTVTIDGDDSKDFDDAITVEKTQTGYRLYVHIADVSHYVQEGSAIDQEAYARGNSVYVVDRCVPMLPFELSNGICSLNPGVDRLTISCVMEIDSQGVITSYSVVPSMIHSTRRCTYSKVNEVLSGNMITQREYSDVLAMLLDFYDLAKLLKMQTEKRGAIEFNTKEPTIVLNKRGNPIDVYVKKRGFAEEMIEEAMIRANVCVAEYLQAHEIPGVYRVHEKPEYEKVVSIFNIAKVFGLRVPFYPDDVQACQIQKFLSSIEDETAKQVLSMVALRSMQKARYDRDCIGHFGLSLDTYCHFTSPIRRYSDLVVHRMLRRYAFEDVQDARKKEKDLTKLLKVCVHISEKERQAIDAERQVNDFKMAQFMENKMGQRFQGTIISVMNFGFFVELENTVEGLVPMHTLMDDYYVFDDATMSLRGENTGRFFQIGQVVDVICTDVDRHKGQITFGICQNKTRKKRNNRR